MLNKLQNRKEEGFTIIEVLIVLAIAGLILLIVFLAVPALQRNSRNTQRKTEAARLLSVTQEYINNNGGNLPAASTCAGTGGAAANCDYTTSPVPVAAQIWQLGNLKNIDGFSILAAGTVTAQTPVLTPGSASQVFLDTGVKCGTVTSTTVTPTTTGATTRSLIEIYAVENQSGNPIAQCTES